MARKSGEVAEKVGRRWRIRWLGAFRLLRVGTLVTQLLYCLLACLLAAPQVERTAVEPHMARLLHCMLLCFKDMAWPVRDAACVACGR